MSGFSWVTAYWNAMAPVSAAMAEGITQGREVLTLSPVRIEERLNA